jgi:redox-sensitive bicupin YhaK (pirin superfamily)
MDIALGAGATFELPVPQGHTTIAYVFEGEGVFGTEPEAQFIRAVSMLVFGEGDGLRARAGEGSHVRFMLISGRPFQEPIFPYGPFVMNTEDEIRQAIHELRTGTFVKVGSGWRDS